MILIGNNKSVTLLELIHNIYKVLLKVYNNTYKNLNKVQKKTEKSMKEIIFNDKVLQKENRVKIPSPIVDSLNIKEGDSLIIILDMEEECIKIMKKKNKK